MDKRHELFDSLAVTLAEFLLGHGIKEDVIDAVCWDAAEMIRKQWGGQQLYIPKGRQEEASRRHQEMYAKYLAGADYVDLAYEYGMTEPAVRLVIRRLRARRKKEMPASYMEVPQRGGVSLLGKGGERSRRREVTTN